MRVELVWLLALGWWLTGCAAVGEGPELLEVRGVHPSVAEPGDRLEIVGNGFPEGLRGTVTLDGQAFRPGAEPRRVRGLATHGVARSRKRVELEVDAELVAALCGRGMAARHTTFRGTIQLAFSPRRPGAPPVTGHVAEVSIDLHPGPSTAAIAEAQLAAGRGTLEALGLTLGPANEREVTVAAVLPAGRAERGGFAAGDAIVEFAGVRLAGPADFAIAPGATEVIARVRRGVLTDPIELRLEVAGLSPRPLEQLSLAALLVALAAGAMLLFLAPLGRVVTWAERRVVAELVVAAGPGWRRERRGQLALRCLGEVARTIVPRDAPPLLRVLPYLAFIGVTGALAFAAFRGVWFSAEGDLPLGVLAQATAFGCVGLGAGGYLARARWSLLAGLRMSLVLLAFEVPLLATLTSAVLSAGSPRVGELVAAQGALPWQWAVANTPAAAIGVLLVLLALVPRPAVAGPTGELDTGGPKTRPARRARALLAAADLGHVLAVTGLLTLACLGGYALPGVTLADQLDSKVLLSLGALWLCLKTWGLVVAVGLLRLVAPALRHDEAGSLFFRVLAPGAGLVIAFAWLWERSGFSPLLAGSTRGLALVLAGLVGLAAASLVLRVVGSLRRPAAQVTVNPWL